MSDTASAPPSARDRASSVASHHSHDSRSNRSRSHRDDRSAGPESERRRREEDREFERERDKERERRRGDSRERRRRDDYDDDYHSSRSSKRRRSSRSRDRGDGYDRDRDRERRSSRRYDDDYDRRSRREPSYDDRSRRRRSPSYDEYARGPPRRMRSPSPQLSEEQREMRSIFVSQLASRVTDRELGIFFENYAGKVRDARVIVDRITRRSKGVGYVEFVDLETVQKALTLSGTKLLGIPVQVQYTEAEKNRQARTGDTGGGSGGPMTGGLYVGSLNFALTSEDLREVFQPFGELETVELHRDPATGKSKGYCFVKYKKHEDAMVAIEKMNNFHLAGREIKVGLVADRSATFNKHILGVGESQLEREESTGKLDNNARIELMQKLARTDRPPELPPTPMFRPNIPQNTTRNVLMKNAFNPEEETERDWHLDLAEDVKGECENQYGKVLDIYVVKESQGEIYIRFEAVESAVKALAGLNGRYFGGRVIEAVWFGRVCFESLRAAGAGYISARLFFFLMASSSSAAPLASSSLSEARQLYNQASRAFIVRDWSGTASLLHDAYLAVPPAPVEAWVESVVRGNSGILPAVDLRRRLDILKITFLATARSSPSSSNGTNSLSKLLELPPDELIKALWHSAISAGDSPAESTTADILPTPAAAFLHPSLANALTFAALKLDDPRAARAIAEAWFGSVDAEVEKLVWETSAQIDLAADFPLDAVGTANGSTGGMSGSSFLGGSGGASGAARSKNEEARRALVGGWLKLLDVLVLHVLPQLGEYEAAGDFVRLQGVENGGWVPDERVEAALRRLTEIPQEEAQADAARLQRQKDLDAAAGERKRDARHAARADKGKGKARDSSPTTSSGSSSGSSPKKGGSGSGSSRRTTRSKSTSPAQGATPRPSPPLPSTSGFAGLRSSLSTYLGRPSPTEAGDAYPPPPLSRSPFAAVLSYFRYHYSTDPIRMVSVIAFLFAFLTWARRRIVLRRGRGESGLGVRDMLRVVGGKVGETVKMATRVTAM
ncbi:hypothetical protein JCM10207_008776 [Rhodosporidiobolus poonsookiae]